MTLTRVLTVGLLTAVSLATGSLNAQILRYDLTGLSSTTPPATANATTVAGGISASSLTRGAGIGPSGLGNGFSANGWNNINSTANPVSATLANAELGNEFFQFGLSINSGYTASLSTLDVSLRRSAVAAPMNYEWQYSFDGFTTAGITIADFNYYGRSSGTAPGTVDPYSWMTLDVAGQNAGNPMSTIDLSSITALQNLDEGETVTFRLFAWGDDSNPGADSNTIALGRVDGPTIGGLVTPVPEPSTWALFGLGITALGFTKIRRSAPRNG